MDKKSKISTLNWILLVGCLLSGGFHEYVSCAMSVALGVYLIAKIRKQKYIKIKKGLFSLAIVSICVGYGLSCFWAVDSGMAWIGFCKFAPLLLYMISLWQTDEQGQLRQILPWFGAITVVISVVCMHIPVLNRYFSVAGRLAGFFQYPNTYALFLLICELLFVTQQPNRKWHWLIPIVLAMGILYTGSRTVFVLFVVSNLALMIMHNRKTFWYLVPLLVGGILFAVAVMLWGKDTVLYRYLNISLTESTFVGRILYAVDALPLLLRYPFGMGYMGYYYIQSSVQTGLYSVMYAHNDLLQLFLDVGLIPGTLFLIAICSYLRKKETNPKNKIIVGTILLHCLLDFDLQFILMFLLLTYLMDDATAKTVNLKCLWVKAGAGVMVAVSVYMSIPLLAAHMDCRQLADAMYPYHTQNQLKMLEQETDIASADALSKKIMSRNTACYVPYIIQSQCAYSQGDFLSVMTNKRLVLQKAPFCYEEYVQYCLMLINGAKAYLQNGDVESAEVCHRELCEVVLQLANTKDKISILGSMIKDQPRFDLPEEIQSYVNQIMSENQ